MVKSGAFLGRFLRFSLEVARSRALVCIGSMATDSEEKAPRFLALQIKDTMVQCCNRVYKL